MGFSMQHRNRARLSDGSTYREAQLWHASVKELSRPDDDGPEPATRPAFGFSASAVSDNTPRARQSVAFGFTTER